MTMTKHCLTVFKIVILGFLISCNFEMFEEHYSSYEEAEKDGAVERMMVPSFLPRSSHDIYIKYDISNPEHWVTFQFPANELRTLDSILIVPDSAQLVRARRALQDEFDLESKRIAYYIWLDYQEAYVAIDSLNMTGYLYSP